MKNEGREKGQREGETVTEGPEERQQISFIIVSWSFVYLCVCFIFRSVSPHRPTPSTSLPTVLMCDCIHTHTHIHTGVVRVCVWYVVFIYL